MGTILIKHDEKLTLLAQGLFGKDLVKRAYFTHYDVSGLFGSTRQDMVNELLKKVVVNDGDNGEIILRHDNETIVIEFTNGHKVSFGNSEWGSMDTFPSWRDEIVEIQAE